MTKSSTGLEWLTTEEFERRHGALRDRIFVPKKSFPPDVDRLELFSDSSWQAVLLPAALVRWVPPDKNDDDSDDSPEEFRGDDLAFEGWNPLVETLADIGVKEIIVTNARILPEPHIQSLVCKPNWECFEQIAIDETDLTIGGVEIFAEDARWGVETSQDEYGILGGDEDFMRRFLAKSGGIDAVRSRAIEFLGLEWYSPDWDDDRNEILGFVGWAPS